MATTPFLTTVSGTATSVIPLPTAWPSAGADCGQAIYEQLAGTFLAWDPWYADYIDGDLTTCWPPQASSWWNQNASPTTALGTTFVCPGAYHQAYTSSVDSQTTSTICCPSGYNLHVADFAKPTFPSQCTSTLTAGETLSWEQIVYESSVGNTWTAATTTVQSETLTIYGVPVNGFNVVATSTTASSGSGSAGAGKTTATTSASSSSTPSSRSSPSSGSTDLGVAVGASVGTVVGLLLIFGGAFSFWRRRRHRGRGARAGRPTGLDANEAGNGHVLAGYYAPGGQNPAELKGSHHGSHELAGDRHIAAHELPGE